MTLRATIGSNHCLVTFNSFDVLFSYAVPVGLRAGANSCRVKYSATTSRHQGAFGFLVFPEVSQAELDRRLDQLLKGTQ